MRVTFALALACLWTNSALSLGCVGERRVKNRPRPRCLIFI